MRITGGEYRGRKISTGKTLKIRPATDRVRETIFAILPQYVDLGVTMVMDLYAGTGSLGFESISRGAPFVIFVDVDREAGRLIEKTAGELQCGDKCEIVIKDVEKYMLRAEKPAGLIFADPPYKMQGLELLPKNISCSGIAEKNGMLLIEHDKRTEFIQDESFACVRKKKFGDTIVSFFEMSGNNLPARKI